MRLEMLSVHELVLHVFVITSVRSLVTNHYDPTTHSITSREAAELSVVPAVNASCPYPVWTSSTTGVIFSPNYPGNYPPFSACAFSLDAGDGGYVSLRFVGTFDIESAKDSCKYDSVEVRDGPFGFSPLITKACNWNEPSKGFNSTSRYLWVGFHSDDSSQFSGFKAWFSFRPHAQKQPVVAPPEVCRLRSSLPFGLFSETPIFEKYNTYDLASIGSFDCTFEITLPYLSKVLVQFEVFKMTFGASCMWNSLVVYSGMSHPEFESNRFCGTKVNRFTVHSNTVYLRFTGSSQGTGDMYFQGTYTRFTEPPCSEAQISCMNGKMCIDKAHICGPTPVEKCLQKVEDAPLACDAILHPSLQSGPGGGGGSSGQASGQEALELPGAAWIIAVMVAAIILIIFSIIVYTVCCYPKKQMLRMQSYSRTSQAFLDKSGRPPDIIRLGNDVYKRDRGDGGRNESFLNGNTLSDSLTTVAFSTYSKRSK